MAKALIKALVGQFRPEQYKDTYRENLEKLIAAKAKGKEIAPAAEPKAAKVVDIMDALKRSLEEAKAASRKPMGGERLEKKRQAQRKSV